MPKDIRNFFFGSKVVSFCLSDLLFVDSISNEGLVTLLLSSADRSSCSLCYKYWHPREVKERRCVSSLYPQLLFLLLITWLSLLFVKSMIQDDDLCIIDSDEEVKQQGQRYG
jgi:hypothetical protein